MRPPKRRDYKCIVVDPPWNQGKTGKRSVRPNQGTELDYPTMIFGEIVTLPVHTWCADNSFLWLWATNSKDKTTKRPILTQAFEILKFWNFQYYTILTWSKPTGPCPFGPYQITTEHILFAYRGKCEFPKESLGKMKTCFEAPVTRHSEKPALLYENIHKYFPGPRLDVFARQRHEGFDAWGDQVQAT